MSYGSGSYGLAAPEPQAPPVTYGTPALRVEGATARATLVAAGNAAPADGSVLTVGDVTYAFKTTLTGGINEIKIGATLSDCIDRLKAVMANGGDTVNYKGPDPHPWAWSITSFVGNFHIDTKEATSLYNNETAITDIAEFVSGTSEAPFLNGVDPVEPTLAEVGEMYADSGNLYVCLTVDGDPTWGKATLVAHE